MRNVFAELVTKKVNRAELAGAVMGAKLALAGQLYEIFFTGQRWLPGIGGGTESRGRSLLCDATLNKSAFYYSNIPKPLPRLDA
jgi:hypothetical protein